jgi:hypothetical protein
LWFTSVTEIGPYSDARAPPGKTTVTASMCTAGFDPAVASSADDPWRISVTRSWSSPARWDRSS